MSGAFRLGNFIALKQFQIVQTDFDHVEIRYVPEAAQAPAAVDLPALTERVGKILRQPVEVLLRSVDKIDRSASGKYRSASASFPAAAPVPHPVNRDPARGDEIRRHKMWPGRLICVR